MLTTRVLVVVSVACAATAMGIVIWRATCATCGAAREVSEFAPLPYISDEENSTRKHVWEGIYKPAVEEGRVADSQLRELHEYLQLSQPYFVRELATNVMAELVLVGVQMSDDSRELVAQSFLTLLQDDEWGMRRLAVTNAQTIGLLRDQRVHQMVRSMSNDPRAEVANRVNRIDWSDPKNGG